MYIYKLLHNKNPTNESSQHSFHLEHERGHWVHYALTSFFEKRKKERKTYKKTRSVWKTQGVVTSQLLPCYKLCYYQKQNDHVRMWI